MDIKEYNRIRNGKDPRKSFITHLRSHARILERCGYTVMPPAPATLEEKVTEYLASRPSRERIV